MVIYVSSPLTLGDSAANVHMAIKVAEALINKGHAVIVPQLSLLWQIVSPKPWQYWMDLDVQLVPRCDALFRIPGESKGADLEVACAREHGLTIYHTVKQVPWGRVE